MKRNCSYLDLLNLIQEGKQPLRVEYNDDGYLWDSAENEYVMASPVESCCEVDFTLTKAMMDMTSMFNKDICYEDDILPVKTKEYIKRVIEPFKDQVRYLELRRICRYPQLELYPDDKKFEAIDHIIEKFYLTIVTAELPELSLSRIKDLPQIEDLVLPAVPGRLRSKIYGTMDTGIHYSLKDLGIDN